MWRQGCVPVVLHIKSLVTPIILWCAKMIGDRVLERTYGKVDLFLSIWAYPIDH
jgi:hypothetical protein